MANPSYDKRSTLPGSAGWYEPNGDFHPFNCDLEPDAEYAARVKDLGARSAIASLGGVIVSASSADQVRAAKSSIDTLLYEMQHPKQVVYESPADVVLPAAASTAVTPVLDVNAYRWIGWWLVNTGGVNNITGEILYICGTPAGVAVPWYCAIGSALAIAPGGANYTQRATIAAGNWDPTNTTPLAERYITIYATSAVGSTGRCRVVGMR